MEVECKLSLSGSEMFTIISLVHEHEISKFIKELSASRQVGRSWNVDISKHEARFCCRLQSAESSGPEFECFVFFPLPAKMQSDG